MTDASGQVAASFSWSPYGTLTGSTGTATTPFGFAGQYTDPETGFQYLRARYYDPQTAAFITRDPLGLGSGETNLYGYAGRDPEDLVDPSGLCSLAPWKSDACTAEAAAGLLDGLTGGLSTKAAGAVIGFNPDCTDFGSGWAHDLGFGAAMVGGFGEEEAAAEGGGNLIERVTVDSGGKLQGPPRPPLQEQVGNAREEMQKAQDFLQRQRDIEGSNETIRRRKSLELLANIHDILEGI